MDFDWEADRLEGRWWAPELESKQVGASLVRNEHGHRELHLLGWPGEWNGMRDLANLPKVLHGSVGGKAVTLFGCRVVSGSVSGNDEPSRLVAAMELGLGGQHIAVATDAVFDNAIVRIDYLNEWADRRPFDFAEQRPGASDGGLGITYTQHEPLTGSLPGANIRLERSYLGGLHNNGLSSATMASNERLVFEFDTPLAVDTIEHDYLRPVANMLSLASRRYCPTLELVVGVESPSLGDGSTVLRNRKGSPDGGAQRSSPLLFHCHDLGFDRTIARWFEIHEHLGVVCDLLTSLRESGNLANHYLNIATALEGYHRRVAGKGKKGGRHTYRSRIDDLLKAASVHFEPKIGNSDKWANWLKEGRNSIAHREPTMVDIEKEWRAAHVITRSAEWLLVVLLLQDLGLSEGHIRWVLGRRQSWGFMTDHLRYALPDLFK